MTSNSQTRLVIIDDELAHRILIRRALERSIPHCIIREYGTPRELREELKTNAEQPEVDLILLDLNLGAERGTDLIETLRASIAPEPKPIILISTTNIESEIQECYLRGASCFVMKHTDPKRFAHDITACVRFFLPTSARANSDTLSA